MPFTFGEDSFNKGESTGVSCMIVKGDLPITIKWILNSALIISNEDGISIVKLSAKTSVLNIASVDEQHRGLIKCIAENAAGSTEYASELHVNGILSTIILMSFIFFPHDFSSIVLLFYKHFCCCHIIDSFTIPI